MNLIINPGFEDSPDFFGWGKTLTGVVFNSSDGRSLPNCVKLYASYAMVTPPPNPTFSLVQGAVYQDPSFCLDQVYVLSAWVKTSAPYGPIEMTVGGTEIARVDEDTGGDWALLAGLWKADAAVARVQVRALRGDGFGTGIWLVDDAEVAMARGGYITYSALITALKQITTANGFNCDVGNRVYPKMVRPEAGLKLPYIVVFPDPDQPPDEDRETYLWARWRFIITAFMPGSESMAEATSATRHVLDIRDDIRKAVKPYGAGAVLPLNSAGVADVSPNDSGQQMLAGVPDGYSYVETSYPVILSVPLTAENLGPNGV